ncbi:uncharacterized protein LOC123880359 [Maniola jurtina]|uniref:uncharacterized protein LOC123880359 n=1 Tax=Maniola jurtina TaxID=191418 RepID=UPI001E68A4FA|nr:uncharacterized protein LOC123880359 [Maniola jurtina]
MYSQSRDTLDDEFGRPVESIMRCEDFKSNFARRLSNRYISKSPVSGPRQDNVLKLRPTADKQEMLNNVPERIEQCPQLSKNDNLEQNEEVLKPPDTAVKNNADIRHTEVNALKMEVETLRWQLSQTEANRQMHIALLQQIVTFLNRVKEHIENQKTDTAVPLDTMPPEVFPKSLNITDLPRSRSVFHVSRNLDYSLSPTKKISTRKISKSISNVNGYKDCSSFWSQSKLSLVSENETGQKLTEEMSRLITLANTVLSTKLPDLTCSCVGGRMESTSPLVEAKNDQTSAQIVSKSLDLIEENVTDTIVLDTNCKNEIYNGITNGLEDVNNRILSEFIVSQAPLGCGLENEFSGIKLYDQEHPSSENGFVESCEKVVQKLDKRNEYNVSTHFIEDESGFSSMSSFQEIGIPIISIIPPSPCKEVQNFEEISNETEKWQADAIELDKQSVKVFWV